MFFDIPISLQIAIHTSIVFVIEHFDRARTIGTGSFFQYFFGIKYFENE